MKIKKISFFSVLGVFVGVAAAAQSPVVQGDAGRSSDAGVVRDAGLRADAGVVTARAPLSADVRALVDRVQTFYESTKDFRADFRQDYTYKILKRTQTSTGTVTYRKPALMRWEYLKPSARTFVLAGDKVYAYDPDAKLLTRASIATNTLSASVTFLWGQGKLMDEFEIVKKPCSSCKGVLLEMTPLKADPRFKRVFLEVDHATAQVLKSTVIDPDGSENAISFIKLTPNVGVEESVFKLSPPAGTQVQDFTAPKADAKP
jgi:outer membrane lipoprotein carrier protein